MLGLERSDRDATKEHPEGEREGWRERVNAKLTLASVGLGDAHRSDGSGFILPGE
jgi:hypothetical protein